MPITTRVRTSRYLYGRGGGAATRGMVAVKNRAHGARNPFAQQRKPVTLEEVMSSRPVAEPLTLLQCCPSVVAGAAAVVLTTKHPTGSRPAVRILGSAVQSGRIEIGRQPVLEDRKSTRLNSRH